MSSLSSVEAKLPPGFRFHPRDDELICDYLMKWVNGCPRQPPTLIQVDLNKCEPWDIPEIACVGRNEWYFYSKRDKKYATGLRNNRATISGYWKATGKDRAVIRKETLVGMRKTLVFYEGRAPKGRKSYWVMHEFRVQPGIIEPDPKIASSIKEDYVLCRVFYKNRSESNPRNEQETAISRDDTSTPSLPFLTEPHNTFGQIQSNTDGHFHQQVPCFSIFAYNQTSPNFSLFAHRPPQIAQSTKMVPNFSGILPHPNSPQAPGSDNKMIKDVLKNITKMESSSDLVNCSMKGSSSFGEGNSDSYVSEIGMSFMWNNYPS